MHFFNLLNVINIMMFISWIIGSSFLPNKIPYFTIVFQLFIAMFLIYKYNPFAVSQFTSVDKPIIFTAAITIFTTTVTTIYHELHKGSQFYNFLTPM